VTDVAVTRISGASYTTTIALAGVAVAGLVDARTGLIFDPLVATILATTATTAIVEGAPIRGFEGAICAVAALGAVWLATLGLGIGLGDVKLGSVVGIGLGCYGALTALALAFILGAGYGIALVSLRRADRRSAIPFAPFIAGGTFIAVTLPRGGIH
jgi:leader peptidase (prepilin peptidase)/N-methyltransferase